MTRQEYIHKKILVVKQTMVSFNRWSVVLFIVAMASIGIPLISSFDKSFTVELLKYGLSSITVLSGAALQGVKYLRKNKLLELEYCEGIVEQYENLQEFDKKVVNSALDGIFNK